MPLIDKATTYLLDTLAKNEEFRKERICRNPLYLLQINRKES